MNNQYQEVISWLTKQYKSGKPVDYPTFSDGLYIQNYKISDELAIEVYVMHPEGRFYTVDGSKLYYVNKVYYVDKEDEVKRALCKFWMTNPEIHCTYKDFPYSRLIKVKGYINYRNRTSPEREGSRGLREESKDCTDLLLWKLREFNDKGIQMLSNQIPLRLINLAIEVEQEAPNREKYLLKLERKLNAS